MKLNVRFILATFVTVLIISISSSIIFYSVASRVLIQQQSKAILNATTEFAFNFQNELQKIDEDFQQSFQKAKNFSQLNLDSTKVDYVFTLANDTLINANEFKIKNGSYLIIRNTSFQKFFIENPTLVLRYLQLKDGKTYYYGKTISSEMLDRIGSKIHADVALVVNEAPVEVSNTERNKVGMKCIVNASRDLKFKNSFDLYSETMDDQDFISALYSPRFTQFSNSNVNFIIFQSFREGYEFRNTLQTVMLLIIIAGSAVTIIIVLVSTVKLRKQISLLSVAAEESGKGNLDFRVPVITTDEIGMLGVTFNKMLDEIRQNKNAEKEYSEFIALINQNPTLREISDAALSKIIKSTHLSFGALYLVQDKTLRLISSIGIGKQILNSSYEMEMVSNAINKNELTEFAFKDNHPEINTGIAIVKIQYLILCPIVYNKETIAILELASESEPKSNIKEYLNSINEQLAIGLVNAKSFEQLENLVNELTKLNEDYHKQNEQIVSQNDELKILHVQLKEKASELEKQKEKALELTKVKSDFLASMSHELRTPLISILGLSELLLKDIGVAQKVKDRLKIIDRNGKKLLGLINNILEFSKFESGKIDVKKETFMLGEFVEEIVPSINQLVAEKELQLILDLPKNKSVLLNTDKVKLEQIILNLFVNAVKFTERGFVKIKAVVDGVSDLRIIVEDSGIGISEENQKIIFEEFKQVDGSISRKYGGAGLGLAICKKYSEILGGKLLLKSSEGVGSEFTICLYEVILDVIENVHHEFLTVHDNKISGDKEKERVLLINDNISACNLIGDYLSSYDLHVEIINNSAAALSLIDEKVYKAIIVNPLDNSWQLASKICQTKINSSTPIIFTLILEDKNIGWEPDISGFMLQPVNEQLVNECISKVKSRDDENTVQITFVGFESKNLYFSGNQFPEIKIHQAKNLKRLLTQPELTSIDHIIVNLEILNEEALEICYAVSINKNLRGKPITFILPKNISNELNEKLNTKFVDLALKIKAHPLDILKILRDKLKIDEEDANKKMQLIIEDREVPNTIEPKSNKKGPTVLIVDDDNDALFTIGEYVKELGYETIFAHNGIECLSIINHVNPDLILLDIMMPKMDGFETIKNIRENRKYSKIPVIALTAYAMLGNKNVIEKNGFSDLITKPINSQILSAKLSKYLSIKTGV